MRVALCCGLLTDMNLIGQTITAIETRMQDMEVVGSINQSPMPVQ